MATEDTDKAGRLRPGQCSRGDISGHNHEHGHGDCGIDWRRRPLSYLLVAMARFYQVAFSRWLGRQCRFVPTCSEYFIQSVAQQGAIKGGLKGIWRICRCNPFSRGGYDPPKGP